MKKLIILIIAVLIYSSCRESEQTYWTIFYPRTVEYMFLYSAYKNPVIWDNKIQNYEYGIHFGSVDSKISVDSFALEIWTHNLNIDSMIRVRDPNFDELIRTKISSPITMLQEQLGSSYIKHFNSLSSPSKGETLNPIDIEYRTDGVTDLNIYALDATLFGKSPGNLLNNYFEIGRYEPWFLASYESKSLLYGFFDKSIPSSIDEWLYNKPLAQPEMFLTFNRTPDNLPVTTRFAVKMTLDNGKQLNDTSAYITIYK